MGSFGLWGICNRRSRKARVRRVMLLCEALRNENSFLLDGSRYCRKNPRDEKEMKLACDKISV
jgi:hypothetical protein